MQKCGKKIIIASVMTKFNVKDFQKQVLSELNLIRDMEQTKFSTLSETATSSAEKPGCLWMLVFRGLDKISKKSTENYKEQKQSEKWEKEAERLLAVIVIREALCSALQNIVKREILNDERLVNIVIETLADDAYKKTFAIHLEPVLFGFISYKLSEIGIEKYCSR